MHSLQTNHYHHRRHHGTIVLFTDTLNCYTFIFQASNKNEAAPEAWFDQENPELEFTEDTNTSQTQNISKQEMIVTMLLHFLFE